MESEITVPEAEARFQSEQIHGQLACDLAGVKFVGIQKNVGGRADLILFQPTNGLCKGTTLAVEVFSPPRAIIYKIRYITAGDLLFLANSPRSTLPQRTARPNPSPNRAGRAVIIQGTVAPEGYRTKLSILLEHMAEARWHEALKMAAKFPDLGPQKVAITRGADALNHPQFYRELGKDPDDLVVIGLAALRARYGAKQCTR
jgi:hypothetical protein